MEETECQDQDCKGKDDCEHKLLGLFHGYGEITRLCVKNKSNKGLVT